jgi:hypothetical protein
MEMTTSHEIDLEATLELNVFDSEPPIYEKSIEAWRELLKAGKRVKVAESSHLTPYYGAVTPIGGVS